jgi:hypothetical protein
MCNASLLSAEANRLNTGKTRIHENAISFSSQKADMLFQSGKLQFSL